MPPDGFPFMMPKPIATKGVRIDVAQNGYVVYMRNGNLGEDVRIAGNLSVVQHMLKEYFSNPIPLNATEPS